MLATIKSFAIIGLDAELVTVEVDLAQGLPGLTIVGLPDKAVEEAKERVRSAIRNTGARFPLKRITINLAPADLKKAGPAYDLPIAIGILAADEQLPKLVSPAIMAGELALDGSVRPIAGVLSIALAAQENGIKDVYVPYANASEAAIVKGLNIFGVKSLRELIDHLLNHHKIEQTESLEISNVETRKIAVDFSDIKGQTQAKRALEVAAAGGHNLLLTGPPGAGKTLMAKAFAGILPPLTKEEILEVTRIHSVAGNLANGSGVVTERPVRSPHHTASAIALIGGGAWPRPGEISLAHRGVLFLDELPEFPRSVLEVLRQPLEDGIVTVSRAQGSVTFPAKFTLIAAQNPCPCGRAGTSKCTCSSNQIIRYNRRVSGPFLDRIDLCLSVPAVEYDDLSSTKSEESSASIRSRVTNARQIQYERFNRTATNSEMSNRQMKEQVVISEEAKQIIKQAVEHFGLSARLYHRLIKVAQTIADLSESSTIESPHIAEAIQYRPQLDSSLHEKAVA